MKKLCAFVAILNIAFPTIAFAASFKIPSRVDVIPRAEWGANEEYTFVKGERKNEKTDEQNGHDSEKSPIRADPGLTEIERIETHDASGREYVWPLEYAEQIKFIVIHYTGLGNELPDDPVQEMKNIFQAHSVSRGWGDIGYHFLIDRKGRVYEGRKGGPFVIGGHALPVNKVSIGISLMGNYNEEDVPAEMLASTLALLNQLTKQYHIDPLGNSEYKGKIYPNIHGHSDNDAKQDPGRYFDEKFPAVRQALAYFRSKKFKADPEKYNFSPEPARELVSVETEGTGKFSIRMKNTGTVTWRKKTFIENNSDSSLPKIFAKLETKRVKPGGLGIFEGTLENPVPSGLYLPKLSLVINGNLRPKKEIPYPLAVYGEEKPLRVALSFNGKPKIRSSQGMTVQDGKKRKWAFGKDETVRVSRLKNGKYRLKAGERIMEMLSPPRFTAKNRGILEILNFENRPAWNRELNDNLFRGTLEVQKTDGRLRVINELPLEDYVKGVAEISNSDPREKIKTILILARSYAKYYRDNARKFPGKPYDLDDDPDHTQKYVGYGLELRSPNMVKTAGETRGQMVTFEGKPILTPYFNQSDGRTRSAQEAWGWKNTPYLQSVPDAFCGTTVLKGHGVGLSGCGATELARQGKTARQIIQYYMPGVEIMGEK